MLLTLLPSFLLSFPRLFFSHLKTIITTRKVLHLHPFSAASYLHSEKIALGVHRISLVTENAKDLYAFLCKLGLPLVYEYQEVQDSFFSTHFSCMFSLRNNVKLEVRTPAVNRFTKRIIHQESFVAFTKNPELTFDTISKKLGDHTISTCKNSKPLPHCDYPGTPSSLPFRFKTMTVSPTLKLWMNHPVIEEQLDDSTLEWRRRAKVQPIGGLLDPASSSFMFATSPLGIASCKEIVYSVQNDSNEMNLLMKMLGKPRKMDEKLKTHTWNVNDGTNFVVKLEDEMKKSSVSVIKLQVHSVLETQRHLESVGLLTSQGEEVPTIDFNVKQQLGIQLELISQSGSAKIRIGI